MAEIKRLLVANRGEIACRIFDSCRRAASPIETVAVFSDADRNAAHVRDADISVGLGGNTSAESYLVGDKILDAARRSEADAIHPGYGFLSENADFAQAVIDAGLIWVGPTPNSIRRMALKVEAKRIAEAAGVPLVPGAELAIADSDVDLLAAAERVGYPLVVKASAGGGGKGMRTVALAGGLLEAVAGARREAQSSFGDPTVFFERYLTRARHVEVQVFGDTHGNVVHLFERECSIQRRHQKIVEESPSPGATPATLAKMFDAAVSLTTAIDYVGAGTVEFMVTGDGAEQEFFFLEMNTRLQVEHAVTERVTGLDLVQWQLGVAGGERLPLTQDGIDRAGHAIEVRIYAEDPGNNYLPSVGSVVAFDGGALDGDESHGGRPRQDLGLAAGDEITPFYDPLIAKIIATAPSRKQAAAELARCLRRWNIAGITTNRDLLVAILESGAFLAGATATSFLDEHSGLLTPSLDPSIRHRHLAAATIAQALRDRRASAWSLIAPIGWRNVSTVAQTTKWQYHDGAGTQERTVVASWRNSGCGVLDGVEFSLVEFVDRREGDSTGHDEIAFRLELAGIATKLRVTSFGEWTWVNDGTNSTTYRLMPRFSESTLVGGGGGPESPLPGTVVAVAVRAGDVVVEGQSLVVVEAMKMEHKIAASVDAVVKDVLVEVGQAVDAHQVLVVFEKP